ncbi:MAG TPA: MFS transporter [Candidatus Binatia bacterium]|nr:MFS transporter [Candidatus Binatia bacterium]
MTSPSVSYSRVRRPRIFYGWYIVAVGFLSHVVCAFHMSSTLSVFLKPLTEDLHVSRGLFSLLRSGEIVIGAAMAPIVGPLVDRYGGRWLMAGGALMAGAGFVLLGQVSEFWQFLLIRWGLVTFGGVFLCQVVITVSIARWFRRKRGRALAIASLGQGLSKVAIPLVTAFLFAWIGWRQTWVVFGLITLALVVLPAIIFLRRSPEDLGMKPDGIDELAGDPVSTAEASRSPSAVARAPMDEAVWSRREVLRTKTFWLICLTYGIVNVGIAGLNLHIFAYVSDIGYPAMISATVMSIIATTQLGSTLVWGLLSERMSVNKVTMIMFLVQGVGLVIAISTVELALVYAGFFIYGAGLGGSQVLQELIWAHYYGRASLGTVRGLGIFISHTIGAAGAPFFGFLHDVTGSYTSSFVLFVIAVLISAFSILWVRAPVK